MNSRSVDCTGYLGFFIITTACWLLYWWTFWFCITILIDLRMEHWYLPKFNENSSLDGHYSVNYRMYYTGYSICSALTMTCIYIRICITVACEVHTAHASCNSLVRPEDIMLAYFESNRSTHWAQLGLIIWLRVNLLLLSMCLLLINLMTDRGCTIEDCHVETSLMLQYNH